MTSTDICIPLADSRQIYRVEDVSRAQEESAPSRNEALASGAGEFLRAHESAGRDPFRGEAEPQR